MTRVSSRLQKVEEARNKRKAFLLAVVTIVILVIVVVWGIPTVVRLVSFIADLGASGRPVDKSDSIPPGPPVVIVNYEATNSATLVARGLSEPGSTVYLTNNSDSIGNVVAKEDGTWVVSVSLHDGENELIAVAMDQAGNKSHESTSETVYFSVKAPDFTVDSPSDRQVVTGKEARVEIKGKTISGAKVTANSRIIIVGTDGRFNSWYNLAAGENTLILIATDKAGNQARKEMVVTYNP